MTTIVAAAGGGSWTAGGTWVGGVAPTAADDAVLDATSGNVTLTSSTAPLCRSLDCTGYTGTLAHQATCTWTVGDGTRGDFKFSAGMSYTRASTSSSILLFASTTTGNLITFAGKTVSAMQFNGAGGAWTFQDTCTANALTTLTAGTLDMGTGLTHNMFQIQSTNSNVRTLSLHDCIINLSGNFNGSFDLTILTNLTFNAGTSSIVMTANGPITQLMRTGGVTFYDFSVTGSGTIGIVGNNTFHNFTRSNAAACGLTLPSGGTQTITGTLTLSGTAGNLVTLTSSTNGSQTHFSKASGSVTVDYVSFKDQDATGGAVFTGGSNSINVSNNTGWILPAVTVYSSARIGGMRR